jgi:hypothetical protein
LLSISTPSVQRPPSSRRSKCHALDSGRRSSEYDYASGWTKLVWTYGDPSFWQQQVKIFSMLMRVRHQSRHLLYDVRASVASELCRRGLKAIVGPTIRFGHSPAQESHPGYVNLRPEVLTDQTEDVASCLSRQGLRNTLGLEDIGPDRPAHNGPTGEGHRAQRLSWACMHRCYGGVGYSTLAGRCAHPNLIHQAYLPVNSKRCGS